MSDSYLDGKVREALVAAKGSRTLAQNTLMVWAMQDNRLLRLMAQPFIKAIAGNAVDRALKRGVTVPGSGASPAKAPTTLSKEDLALVLSQVGGGAAEAEPEGVGLTAADIFGGGGGGKAGAAPTAARRPGVPAKPVDQATAIRTLAAVYAKNRKRT